MTANYELISAMKQSQQSIQGGYITAVSEGATQRNAKKTIKYSNLSQIVSIDIMTR